MLKKSVLAVLLLSMFFVLPGIFSNQTVNAKPKPPLAENEPDPFQGIRIEDYSDGLDEATIEASFAAFIHYRANFDISDAPSNAEVYKEVTDDMIQLGNTYYYLVPNVQLEKLDDYTDSPTIALKARTEYTGQYFGTSTTYLSENYNFVLNDFFYVYMGSYHSVYRINDWCETYKIVKVDYSATNETLDLNNYSLRTYHLELDGEYSSGWPLEAASGAVERYLQDLYQIYN